MNAMYESAKIDVALVPAVLNNTNITGLYFPMKDFFKALAILQVGAMAASKVVTLELWGGVGPLGIGAALITGATCTVGANVLVSKATLFPVSVLAAQTVTINGLVFTAHATTTTPANREFSVSGDDSADAAALAGLINDATYGVPGITAVASAGTITLTATEPGVVTITLAQSDATVTFATLEAQAYVELDNMDLTAGFDHVAAKVTSTANGIVSVLLLRSPRDSAVQKVGAGASV